ncbi:MAG: hypothetical protein WCJ61_17945 [Paludibacter sp.]
MSNVEKISIDKNRLSNFHSFIATEISESELRKILERNVDYFNLVKEGLVQVAKVKFELVDGIIIMRTFGRDDVEAAKYSVRDDYSLYVYQEVASNKALYSNNGLRVAAYEEDENGHMRYVILNDEGSDIIGESLAYEDAVSFVDNYEVEIDD